MLSALANIYDYNYSYPYDNSYYNPNDPSFAYVLGFLSVLLLPLIIVGILSIIGMWKIYAKAGKPGWAVLVPVYNIIVLLEIVGRPTWWVFLYLLAVIPFVGWIPALVINIIVLNDLAKSFGKDVGYTLLLIFLPFVGNMVLGFGDAKYKGPAAHQHPVAHS